MEIKNRLFLYPVLCSENDDYKDCSFEVKSAISEELTDLIIKFEVVLSGNEELQWLIRDGNAQVIVHIECSYTAYRTVIKINGNQKIIRIPKSKVNHDIAMVAMIVALKDIKEFKSKQLNEDYLDEPVNFDKGAILAYQNLPKIRVTKNYEELAGDNPFFTIIKRAKQNEMEENPVTYILEQPKIQILVDEEIYDEYVKYHGNPMTESLIVSLLILPAIAYMIDVLRENTVESYEQYYWYQKIKKSCKLQGKDFERDIIDSEKSCIEIAQEFLKLPIGRAFKNLSNVIEG